MRDFQDFQMLDKYLPLNDKIRSLMLFPERDAPVPPLARMNAPHLQQLANLVCRLSTGEPALSATNGCVEGGILAVAHVRQQQQHIVPQLLHAVNASKPLLERSSTRTSERNTPRPKDPVADPKKMHHAFITRPRRWPSFQPPTPPAPQSSPSSSPCCSLRRLRRRRRLLSRCPRD